MNRHPSLAALAAGLSLAAGLTTGARAADRPFGLTVEFDLTPQVTSLLQAGDTLQAILRPEVQYGQRSVPGQPTVLETTWSAGLVLPPVEFPHSIDADQIYRLELRVVRKDAQGQVIRVRYLSALDKLPRRPVDKGIKLRLFRADDTDQRENHVYVTQDSDGVYRVMLFFA